MKLKFEGRDHTARFRYSDIKSCRFESICATTGILFFIPLVSKPDSKYGRYWANQGLLILIAEFMCLIAGLILSGIFSLLAMIPAIGTAFKIINKIIAIFLWAAVIFYIVYPMFFALRGRAKDIPFFGYIRIIK